MKNRMLQFDGLYGDLNGHPQSDYIFLELIATRSKQFDWTIRPHIHTRLYQFFFIESGHVEFTSSTTEMEISTPCVLMIPPNMLHGLKYSVDVKGNILTVSDTVMDGICRDAPSVPVSFENAHELSFDGSNDPDYVKIASKLEEMRDELFTSKPEKEAMLRAGFQQLFIFLMRLCYSKETQLPGDGNKTLEHFKNFQSLIKKAATPQSIPQFAKQLGISTVHLNRICNQVSGKPALFHAEGYKIETAKNYLSHTSYSISEIAYLLDFEYPNYFARLFKKMTGLTPTEFRNQKRANGLLS